MDSLDTKNKVNKYVNKNSDLGKYFTHRKVIKYMVELCDPKIKADGSIETILDPTMGTGGFLTINK